MYTLFIDTHAELITVALYSEEDILIKEQESEYSHAVFLAPMIRDILKEKNITFKDIKNVVAVNGPGSFTGLRIGLSEAKTISYSLNIPIYLVSTLDAYLVSDDGKEKLAVIEDNKGYYVKKCKNGEFSNEEYIEDISSYINSYIVPLKLDVEKVIKFALNSKPVNAHLVRANYVKKIEAEK